MTYRVTVWPGGVEPMTGSIASKLRCSLLFPALTAFACAVAPITSALWFRLNPIQWNAPVTQHMTGVASRRGTTDTLPGSQAATPDHGLEPSAGPGGQAMVALALLALILSEAQARNVPLEGLFRGLEIDAGDFDLPGMVISHREAITVVRRALKVMPLAPLGLELGRRAKITERGALALGQLAAATLGDAISLSLRFAASAGHLLQVRQESSAQGNQLVAEPFAGDQDLQRFLIDLTFSSLVQLRRQIASAKYAPAKVEFTYEAPANADAYGVFFGCPVEFGCARNAISTHADWLSLRLPWANVMAYRLSLQLLEREAARFISMPALGFSVERAIRRGLPQIRDLAQVAGSLNLSERTLRRQLSQAGLSYRHLLDESRKSRALDLMAIGPRPVAEIAAEAGFSDPRAFTRAFKRWTGRPPSQIRAYMAAAQNDQAESEGPKGEGAAVGATENKNPP